MTCRKGRISSTRRSTAAALPSNRPRPTFPHNYSQQHLSVRNQKLLLKRSVPIYGRRMHQNRHGRLPQMWGISRNEKSGWGWARRRGTVLSVLRSTRIRMRTRGILLWRGWGVLKSVGSPTTPRDWSSKCRSRTGSISQWWHICATKNSELKQTE